MKKFLSICLVALCSVSAMYAQTTESTTPTPDEKKQDDVACGSNVTVSATSKTGFYHFVKWEIQNNNSSDVLLTVDRNGNYTYGTNNSSNDNYGATFTAPSADSDGKETSTLTLNPLSSTLIDAATSTPKTVTFEAFFDIDSYTISSETEGSGNVEGTGTTTGSNSVTLTAKPDNCSTFVRWEDKDGNTVPGNPGEPNKLTVTPLATWEHGSTHTYTAVFETKKVNIKVTTSDSSKGTVTLSVTAPQ